MKKTDWFRVFSLCFICNIALPFLIAIYAKLFEGISFIKTLGECFLIATFFLSLVLYLPLLREFINLKK